MDEDANHCSLCLKRVGAVRGVPLYFCNADYQTHRPDILANVPWVRFVTAQEKTRRYHRKKRREAGYSERPLLREA